MPAHMPRRPVRQDDVITRAEIAHHDGTRVRRGGTVSREDLLERGASLSSFWERGVNLMGLLTRRPNIMIHKTRNTLRSRGKLIVVCSSAGKNVRRGTKDNSNLAETMENQFEL